MKQPLRWLSVIPLVAITAISLLFTACSGGNESEAPPILLDGAAFSVDENANVGTVIGKLGISEEGGSPSGIALTGSGSEQFVALPDGTISVAEGALLDYESAPSYSLTAIASNSGGSSNGVTVTITINDRVETPPSLKGSQFSIQETAQPGSVVGNVEILASGGSSITSFTLSPVVAGEGSGLFAIDAAGAVTLAEGAVLNYETATSYTFTAVATNSAGASLPADVVIHVTNMAESLPVIGAIDINFPLDIAMPRGTVLGRVPIYSDGGGPITRMYAVGEYADKFAIATDGTVTVASDEYAIPGSAPDFSTFRILQVYAENSAGISIPAFVPLWMLSSEEAFARDAALLTIQYSAGDTELTVTGNLGLPSNAPYRSSVSWSSSMSDVVAPSGQVTRPPYTAINATVKLTLTLTRGAESRSYLYTVTVLKEDAPPGSVTALEDALYTLNINPRPGELLDKNGEPLPAGFNPLKKKNVSIFNTYELAAFNDGIGEARSGIYETLPDENLAVNTPLLLKGIPNATTWLNNIKAGSAVNADDDLYDEVAFAYIADNKDIILYVVDDASGAYGVLYGPAKIGTAPANGTDNLSDNGGDLAMASGDIDGDGREELIVTAGKRWYRYDAAAPCSGYCDATPVIGTTFILDDKLGGFGQIASVTSPFMATAMRVTAEDLDNDGSDELAILYTQALAGIASYPIVSAIVYDYQGGALAQTARIDISGPRTADITSGDLNRNGIPELIVAGINNVEGDIKHAYQSIEWSGSVYQSVSSGSYTDPYATDVFDAANIGNCAAYLYSDKDGCNQIDVLDVMTELLDVDGDNIKELLVNNRVLDRFYQPKLDINGEEMWVWSLLNHAMGNDYYGMKFVRGNFFLTVGDFTGDHREDIAFIQPLHSNIELWGIDDTGDFTYLAAYASSKHAINTYPLLYPVNMDRDSLFVEYTRSEVAFTEPVPMAVVAASPCYNEVWQNQEECTASFGNASSVSTATEDSYKLGAGIKLGGKYAGGGVEFEGTVNASLYYEWAFGSEYSVEKSITFNTGAGEDMVVFTSIPYDIYYYTIVDSPTPTDIGEETLIYMPRKPVVRQTERSFYNAAVSKYRPDATIGAETLTHTPGIISSYPTVAEKSALLTQYGGYEEGPVGVPQGGGSSELGVSTSSGSSFRENWAFEATVEAQLTAGPVIVGLTLGAGYARDITISTTESSSYSASVGGIDAAYYAGNSYNFGIFTYPKNDHPSGFTFHVVNFWVE